MESIAIAAKKNNRKIAIVGRSMKKTIEAASKNGFTKYLDSFINEEETSLIPRGNLVVICTGSQGEKRSALYRIAYNSHKNIHLESGDVVIFSSKDIPGNEKLINNLKNLLIRQKVEIITNEDDLVHVSGHGYADEIKNMYNWTRPFISIPVHGEPKHLVAHSKIAQSTQVPFTKVLENGKCIKLAPNKPEFFANLETGKMIVEGSNLYDSESNFIKDRRKFSFEGMILVSIPINSDLTLHKDIKVSINGLPNDNDKNLINLFKEAFLDEYLTMKNEQKSSDAILSDLTKKLIRRILLQDSNKKPEVNTHIIRI